MCFISGLSFPFYMYLEFYFPFLFELLFLFSLFQIFFNSIAVTHLGFFQVFFLTKGFLTAYWFVWPICMTSQWCKNIKLIKSCNQFTAVHIYNIVSKSLYISCAVRLIYVTEFEIWAGWYWVSWQFFMLSSPLPNVV